MKNIKKIERLTVVAIFIFCFIPLMSMMPLKKIENLFIPQKQKILSAHQAISRKLNVIKVIVDEYHRLNNKLLSKIDDLIPLLKIDDLMPPFLKAEYNLPHGSFDDYVYKTFYDPYGNMFYLDSNNYEIYCNNDEIIKSAREWEQNKDIEAKNLLFRLNYMSSRVECDIISIKENIGNYYKKNQKLPDNVKQLEINIPYQQWGNSYALDNQKYEVVCSGSYSCKESYLDTLREVDYNLYEEIISSFKNKK